MPFVRQIEGPSGSDYWRSFDPDDYKTLAEALKVEVCLRQQKILSYREDPLSSNKTAV
jgi:hypothetical protein